MYEVKRLERKKTLRLAALNEIPEPPKVESSYACRCTAAKSDPSISCAAHAVARFMPVANH